MDYKQDGLPPGQFLGWVTLAFILILTALLAVIRCGTGH